MARVAYDQIYRDLKQDIENGTYGYESLLPSQSKLVSRYGCAHNTARKAIAMLTREGYCLPIHGKGVRIIYRPPSTGDTLLFKGFEGYSEVADKAGMRYSSKVTKFEYVICDEALSRETEFKVGDKLLHLECVHTFDDEPIIRDDGYLLASYVEDITQEEAERTVYGYIEKTSPSTRVASAKRFITMEIASARDHELLKINDCHYIVRVLGKTYDSDARLFEYRKTFGHPKRFRLEYTTLRDRDETFGL